MDNVHNETYKVLGGLARSDKEKGNDVEQLIEAGSDDEAGDSNINNVKKIKKRVS